MIKRNCSDCKWYVGDDLCNVTDGLKYINALSYKQFKTVDTEVIKKLGFCDYERKRK